MYGRPANVELQQLPMHWQADECLLDQVKGLKGDKGWLQGVRDGRNREEMESRHLSMYCAHIEYTESLQHFACF